MSDEARLQRWLASQRNAAADASASDHIDAEMLERHAAGQLAGAKARMVNEHLQVCDDGRCRAFVHAQLAKPPAGQLATSQLRTFQSREIVWNTFESMARELGKPIDELVNAAMAAYAQARGYAPAPPGSHSTVAVAVAMPVADSIPATMLQPSPQILDKPPLHDPLADTNEAGVSALDRSYDKGARPPNTDWDDDLARTSARTKLARAQAANSAGPDSRTTPRRGSFPPPGAAPPEMNQTLASASPRQPEPRARPPELPGGPVTHRMPNAPGSGPEPAAAPRGVSAVKRLVLTYQGRPHPVDKDRYLIGRSTTQSDLRLDDPNVSRQHAVIERVGSAWYIVDLGSTNGVHVAGERITRRAIADGDVVVIITHQIVCAMR